MWLDPKRVSLMKMFGYGLLSIDLLCVCVRFELLYLNGPLFRSKVVCGIAHERRCSACCKRRAYFQKQKETEVAE